MNSALPNVVPPTGGARVKLQVYHYIGRLSDQPVGLVVPSLFPKLARVSAVFNGWQFIPVYSDEWLHLHSHSHWLNSSLQMAIQSIWNRWNFSHIVTANINRPGFHYSSILPESLAMPQKLVPQQLDDFPSNLHSVRSFSS